MTVTVTQEVSALTVENESASLTVSEEAASLTVSASSTSLTVASVGPQGPQGETGATGADGAPGGSAFVFEQDVAVATWNVEHNLGRYAHATILDDDGEAVEADMVYPSVNMIVITFPSPHTGTVVVS